MFKGKNKKKIQVKEFADILFTTLAPQLLYEDVRENYVISKSLRDFSNSILMLSYAYRPVFREKFHGVSQFLTRNFKNNPMLYAYTLAEILSSNYSSYKFLTWCSFVSELHFYMCESQADKKEEYYIEQASLAFRDIFDLTFDVCFFKKPQRWVHVFWTASKISERYTLLKPFLNNRTLNETLSQITVIPAALISSNVYNVFEASGSAPQMNLDRSLTERMIESENEKSASAPGTSCQVMNLVHSLTERMIESENEKSASTPGTSCQVMNLDHSLTERMIESENEKSASTPGTSCQVMNLDHSLTERMIESENEKSASTPGTSCQVMNLDHSLTERMIESENETSGSTPRTSCKVVKTPFRYSDQKDSPLSRCLFSDSEQTDRRSSNNESTEPVSSTMEFRLDDEESSSNSKSKKRRKRTYSQLNENSS